MNEEALEDSFSDIIRKAQEGLENDDNQLSAKAGIPVSSLRKIKEGNLDTDALVRIAPLLGLNGRALSDLAYGRWRPELPIEFAGLKKFTSPGRTGSNVNTYLIWDPATLNGVCFDPGTDAADLLTFAAAHGIRIQLVLLTHAHSDHVAALPTIVAGTDAAAFISKTEKFKGAELFEPGRYFIVGNLYIESRAVPGHSRGSCIYTVSGLKRNLAVVGDTLFAGSMGRAFFSYRELLRGICSQVLTLPADTILCPGHGPMTTVAEEKLHNPFFAEDPAGYAQAA
jgi:hydroxyacylglutathione hydrolase